MQFLQDLLSFEKRKKPVTNKENQKPNTFEMKAMNPDPTHHIGIGAGNWPKQADQTKLIKLQEKKQKIEEPKKKDLGLRISIPRRSLSEAMLWMPHAIAETPAPSQTKAALFSPEPPTYHLGLDTPEPLKTVKAAARK